ncbi:MADS-box transcription factor PHERES 2, partial [Mucuna pruriens]
MTRKKVKLAYISDATARKSTYKKRKKGIIKKVSELTILCGIPACAIISSPFDPKPEIWPNPEGANQVIQRYLNASVLDQSKNVNQESFIIQRIVKAQDQLKKQRCENHEKEMTLCMFQYMKGEDLPNTANELKELDRLLEKNMRQIGNKLAALNSKNYTTMWSLSGLHENKITEHFCDKELLKLRKRTNKENKSKSTHWVRFDKPSQRIFATMRMSTKGNHSNQHANAIYSLHGSKHASRSRKVRNEDMTMTATDSTYAIQLSR